MIMYYRTYFSQNNNTQLTIEDLYAGRTLPTRSGSSIKTIRVENIPPHWYTDTRNFDFAIASYIINNPAEIQYTEYHIPKASGGYRLISAPSDELKELQKKLYEICLHYSAYAHDAAFAYVKDRTCLSAMQRHRDKQTKYFYKFDLHDFFPSCTEAVLQRQLKQVYPFCMLTDENLNQLITIATYNGALPQGSPLSPLLCNMVLIPFDWAMHYSIRHFNGVYTRYADDILISFENKKQLSFIQYLIKNHLPEGLSLNESKSRCGSIAGHNYNLGLVLNKERNITIGHKKKMELKAKINNFIFDFTNQRYWSIIDTQVLQGEVNYFKQIEPDYANFVVNRLENKHHSHSLSSMFADIISGRV
jgi:RNA-directed DNA polymerase